MLIVHGAARIAQPPFPARADCSLAMATALFEYCAKKILARPSFEKIIAGVLRTQWRTILGQLTTELTAARQRGRRYVRRAGHQPALATGASIDIILKVPVRLGAPRLGISRVSAYRLGRATPESNRHTGAHVKTMHAGLRPRLAVVVAAAGLAVAGCASNANTPQAPPASPPSAATNPTSPGTAQPATVHWAASACQALNPVFGQLGPPPQPDMNNLAATRQAYINYLTNARNAAQQAIDRLSAVGAPPVANGQQIVDQTRNQLTQLRTDLGDALAQLNRADPHDAGAIGLAAGAVGNMMGALGNRVQVLATLDTDSQLRAAINQAAECHNLTAITGANQPTQPGSPPS